MKTRLPTQSLSQRVERELERERRERVLNDEARAGTAAGAEFRAKDARQNSNAVGLRRSHER